MDSRLRGNDMDEGWCAVGYSGVIPIRAIGSVPYGRAVVMQMELLSARLNRSASHGLIFDQRFHKYSMC